MTTLTARAAAITGPDPRTAAALVGGGLALAGGRAFRSLFVFVLGS